MQYTHRVQQLTPPQLYINVTAAETKTQNRAFIESFVSGRAALIANRQNNICSTIHSGPKQLF